MNLNDIGEPFAVGNTAKVYLFENKIIKVFNDNLPETESINEAYKQDYAYSCGIHVPKVLDVTKIDGKQALLMEYIPGKTIGELMSHNPEQEEHYLSISVDIHQRIHQIEGECIELMSAKLNRQIKIAPKLEDNIKALLIEKLDSIPIEMRLCHGDYHIYNVISSNRGAATIDWVDASVGNIGADVCRTYLLYSRFSGDMADTYLNLYCKKSGLSKVEILEWAPIIAAARLSEGVSSESSDRLLEIINHYIEAN
ncbi:aminoglycoside phosphotransferase family protein [Halobacillus sp. HZG1]|uniref:aminoglycoside phosphotransferase family protein n=1 Tax=Halobacillus sp. HZG1 TaxID=3111769 RepID=UPI002DBEF9B9|nr:aminoglycoside phosphotransferase family protein [Halobacillus sp. HZG1]MEC3883060.1 aminoglycoside phosphotransferase family protein [Halobacillus sp. HZG1]